MKKLSGKGPSKATPRPKVALVLFFSSNLHWTAHPANGRVLVLYFCRHIAISSKKNGVISSSIYCMKSCVLLLIPFLWRFCLFLFICKPLYCLNYFLKSTSTVGVSRGDIRLHYEPEVWRSHYDIYNAQYDHHVYGVRGSTRWLHRGNTQQYLSLYTPLSFHNQYISREANSFGRFYAVGMSKVLPHLVPRIPRIWQSISWGALWSFASRVVKFCESRVQFETVVIIPWMKIHSDVYEAINENKIYILLHWLLVRSVCGRYDIPVCVLLGCRFWVM